MARITAAGIEPDGIAGYTTKLQTAFRNALGDTLSLSTETPQGQIIGKLAIRLAEVEELAIYVGSGLALDSISGRHIDDWASLLDLPRIAGERSTVVAHVTGNPGTIIRAGARARTEDGAVFENDRQTTITAGETTLLMRSIELGPIVAAAGTLTEVVDAVAGWLTITNRVDATLGRDAETELQYRRRYSSEVRSHARDGLEAVRARILGADGVTGALVRDNAMDTAQTIQGVEIAARSLFCAVNGGADVDIARAIAQTKPLGIATSGIISASFPHVYGFRIPIRFSRVDPIPIRLRLTTTTENSFPADGLATMRRNLLHWFTGTWPLPQQGIFQQDGIGIGQSIDLQRIRTPINAVPGHAIQTLVVERVPGLLASVAVTSGGSGYTTAPEVIISGNSGAAATAVLDGDSVQRVEITNRGDGSLTSRPTVTFRPTGATATASISSTPLGSPRLDQQYTLDSNDITLQIVA